MTEPSPQRQVLGERVPSRGDQALSAEVGEEHPNAGALRELVGQSEGLGHLGDGRSGCGNRW